MRRSPWDVRRRKEEKKKGVFVSPLPNRMFITVASAVVWALVSLATQLAAQQPVLPDVQKLGPQVGSRVPDFTLFDQKGQSQTLASLMGPKGLMLVFYRSADWCPYCKTQLKSGTRVPTCGPSFWTSGSTGWGADCCAVG